MLDKSCRWASMPPTNIPYFSTSLNPTTGLSSNPGAMGIPGTCLASSSEFRQQHLCIRTLWRDRELFSICATSGKLVSRLIDSGGIALCRNAATSGKHIESDSLPKQKVPGSPPYGSDVLDGLERVPFFHMPFHPAHDVNTITRNAKSDLKTTTHSQPSWSNTSVKKGTPASTASELPFPSRWADFSTSPTTYPP